MESFVCHLGKKMVRQFSKYFIRGKDLQFLGSKKSEDSDSNSESGGGDSDDVPF